MNELNDKPFHDWVRQLLDTYRPAYDPHDWAQLQRTLKRRRWWRKGIAGSIGLLLLGLLSWFAVFIKTKTDTLSGPHSAALVPKKLGLSKVSTAHPPLIQRLTAVGVSTKKRALPTKKTNPVYLPKAESRFSQLPVTFLTIRNAVKPVSTTLTETIRPLKPIAYSPEEITIIRQMTTGEFGPDSTSYRAVARNLRQWPNAVLVCDLTTSMYPYTTQLFALLKQYSHDPSIQGMVFFTDCDSLGQQTYPGGPPGRMFVARGHNVVNSLPVLLNAARNTVRNGDDAENDIEALLFAQKEFPQANHLILVADNISKVKGLALLNKVRKPVHVVLCGTTGSDTALAFQPDYYAIASRTRGSLHTLEDDLNPDRISQITTLRVGPHYYRYSVRRKQFKLTPFDHRPKRLLKLIWF